MRQVGNQPRLCDRVSLNRRCLYTVLGDCLTAYDAATRFLLNVWKHQKHRVTSQKTQDIKQDLTDNQPRECEVTSDVSETFCLHHQGVEVAKGQYVSVYLKKKDS